MGFGPDDFNFIICISYCLLYCVYYFSYVKRFVSCLYGSHALRAYVVILPCGTPVRQLSVWLACSIVWKILLYFLSGIEHVLIFCSVLYSTIVDTVRPDSNFVTSVYMIMSLTLCPNLGSTVSTGCCANYCVSTGYLFLT